MQFKCTIFMKYAAVSLAWSTSGNRGIVATRCHRCGARFQPAPLGAKKNLQHQPPAREAKTALTTAWMATAVPEGGAVKAEEASSWFSHRRASVAVVLASSFLNLLGFTSESIFDRAAYVCSFCEAPCI